jgi:hypothetical protein
MPIHPEMIIQALQDWPQAKTPNQIETEQLTLADLRNTNKMSDLQLRTALKNEQEQDQMRALFKGNPDLESAIGKAYAINPTAASAMSKTLLESKKASQELYKMTLENRLLKAKDMARILGTVKDDSTLQVAVRDAVAAGHLTPEQGQQLASTPYSPEVASWVDQKLRESLDGAQQLEQQRKDWEFAKLKEDRPDEKRKLRGEADKAEMDAEAAAFGLVPRTMPTDPQAYAAWRAQQRPEVQAQLPTVYSPAAVEIAQRLGMTADQQVAASDRTKTREQAERFHKDQLGIQRGMLGVAQSNSAETRRYHNEELAANAGKNAQNYSKQIVELGNLEDAVKLYKDELDKTGPTFRTASPEGLKLKTAFTNLQMQLKNLYELGAITGPDMALLNSAITDPASLQANWAGTKALDDQLQMFNSVMKRSKANLQAAYNKANAQDSATSAAKAALGSLSNQQLLNMLMSGGGNNAGTPNQ